MKVQTTKPLSIIYTREEEFSADLAKNLDQLNVGKFDDAETEARVGNLKADIVATGEDGTLVVECQFNKANWDHWGRLEAYARLKEADVAVFVAETFTDIMIATCNLRNEDSKTDWYLIKVFANSQDELSFHYVARPSIYIQIEKSDVQFSEFWQPIKDGEFGDLFSGKPVPNGTEMISKTINGIRMWLWVTKRGCSIRLWFNGKDRYTRFDKVMKLFQESDYPYECKETTKTKIAYFPVLEKGLENQDDWDEIREVLVAMGTDIYNIIDESGL